MLRIIVLLALASLATRSLVGRWPWEVMRAWLRTRPPAPPPTLSGARTLLGVGPEAARADILAAHRKLVFAVHPDRGGDPALVHEANAARDLLLAALGPANRAD